MMTPTAMALRLASKRSSTTATLGRLFIVQEQRQKANLWTVTDTRQGFQLSPQNVQAQPEMASQVFRRMSMEDDNRRNDYADGVSHAQEQESLDAWRFVVLSDPRIHDQLRRSHDQLKPTSTAAGEPAVKKETTRVDNAPLPKTIEDALRPTRRAIVITEAKKPFRVFDVNRAWEDLCGYSYVESREKTLGSLLRGPETDQLAATSLISKLLQGEEAGTTLVNYTKSGRAFQNRIRVGPLQDESGNVTHFVGVLQEIKM